jgi:hypothetical protein
MRRLVYNVRCFVVPINPSVFSHYIDYTTRLEQRSSITTQNIQSLSWSYNRLRLSYIWKRRRIDYRRQGPVDRCDDVTVCKPGSFTVRARYIHNDLWKRLIVNTYVRKFALCKQRSPSRESPYSQLAWKKHATLTVPCAQFCSVFPAAPGKQIFALPPITSVFTLSALFANYFWPAQNLIK